MQEAFAQLSAEGYLSTRTGCATRVADVPAAPPPPAGPPSSRAAPSLVADFRAGVPDLGSFPRADWAWAQREAAKTASTADLGYGDPRGAAEPREVLAAYLRRVRGASADPKDLVICSGFAQGLILALRATGARRVTFEDPGYDAELLAVADWLGVETVPVPVDDEGVDVDALKASGAGAVVFYTGSSMADRGRAERRPATSRRHRPPVDIVEDDYDAEFRYDRDPVGVLQGLASDRVLLTGTVSKSVAPGIRLGWVLCPPALTEKVTSLKAILDRGSPHLDQLALAALLRWRTLRPSSAPYANRLRSPPRLTG